MHGVGSDTRYPYDIELSVMREMHWSPSDYLSAPQEMIEVILEEISSRGHWRRRKEKWDEDMAKS